MTTDAQKELDDIIIILEKNSEGLSRREITENMNYHVNSKTLQRRLSSLANAGLILN